MHIELRDRARATQGADDAAAEQQDLLLVLRSDADGFRFEAVNELGLPVLTWPVPDQSAKAMSGMYGGIDVALVARFIQLALAEPAVWAAALSGTRLQLVAAPDGGRTLLIEHQPRIFIAAVGASPSSTAGRDTRRMLVCMQSRVVVDRCSSGSEVQIDVEDLPETADK
jgi:hypothetical protein